MSVLIQEETIRFLQDLQGNNHREWFQQEKSRYQEALDNFKAWVNEVAKGLQTFDEIEAVKVFRIYRDVRFSTDKTPYKTHFSAGFTRAGKYRRGGFYVQLEPDSFFVGGGFWNPNKDDLSYIRQGIADDATDLKLAISAPDFIARFQELHGEQLKSAPRGYAKDHPEIELLRYKQFLASRNYGLHQVQQPNFDQVVVADFKAMLPFFDAIRDFMLYDNNGEER